MPIKILFYPTGILRLQWIWVNSSYSRDYWLSMCGLRPLAANNKPIFSHLTSAEHLLLTNHIFSFLYEKHLFTFHIFTIWNYFTIFVHSVSPNKMHFPWTKMPWTLPSKASPVLHPGPETQSIVDKHLMHEWYGQAKAPYRLLIHSKILQKSTADFYVLVFIIQLWLSFWEGS